MPAVAGAALARLVAADIGREAVEEAELRAVQQIADAAVADIGAVADDIERGHDVVLLVRRIDAEIEHLHPAARRSAGQLDDFLAGRHQVIGIGRVHHEQRREVRAGQRRRIAGPGLAAIRGVADVGHRVFLPGGLAVGRIDGDIEAIAAVGLVILAIGVDLAAAVVLQAEPDHPVVSDGDAVGQQGVEAGLRAIAPAGLRQAAAAGDVLGIGAAIVAGHQRHAAAVVVIGNPEAGVLVRMRGRAAGRGGAGRGARAIGADHRVVRRSELQRAVLRDRQQIGPDLFKPEGEARRHAAGVGLRRIRAHPEVVVGLDARRIRGRRADQRQCGIGRRVVGDLGGVGHARPARAEVGRDIEAVEQRAVQRIAAEHAGQRFRQVQRREAAVEQHGVLHERVDVVVVLRRADDRPERDAAGAFLRREAGRQQRVCGRDIELHEAAGLAVVRAIQTVAGRAHGAVGKQLLAGAVADRGKHLAAGLAGAAARLLDGHVGHEVRELALARDVDDAGAFRRGRQRDVDVAAAGIGRAEQTLRQREVDDFRMRMVDRGLEAERAIRHAAGLMPGHAEVIAPERAETGVVAAAEARIAGRDDDGAAAGRGPGDRADGLRRQRLADRHPVLALVRRHPDAAGAERGEHALVDRIVVEAVDAAAVVDIALAVDAAVARVVDDQRPAADRRPDHVAVGDRRRQRRQRGLLLERCPEGAGQRQRAGRRGDRIQALALRGREFAEGFRMVEPLAFAFAGFGLDAEAGRTGGRKPGLDQQVRAALRAELLPAGEHGNGNDEGRGGGGLRQAHGRNLDDRRGQCELSVTVKQCPGRACRCRKPGARLAAVDSGRKTAHAFSRRPAYNRRPFAAGPGQNPRQRARKSPEQLPPLPHS